MALIEKEALLEKTVFHDRDDHPLANVIRACVAINRELIAGAPVIRAVPISELIEIRNDLYGNDQITMRGIAKLNALIARYDHD